MVHIDIAKEHAMAKWIKKIITDDKSYNRFVLILGTLMIGCVLLNIYIMSLI